MAGQFQLHATIKKTRNRTPPRDWHPAPRGRQLQGSIFGGHRGSQAPAACHKLCASASTVRGTPKGRLSSLRLLWRLEHAWSFEEKPVNPTRTLCDEAIGQ